MLFRSGQLLVAALILRTPGLMFYIFPLMLAAVVTGVITGLAGRQIVRVLKIPGGSDPFQETGGDT